MAALLKITPQRDEDPLDRFYREVNERLIGKAKIEARTSADVTSIAARGLRRPRDLTDEEIRIVCASALSQAR